MASQPMPDAPVTGVCLPCSPVASGLAPWCPGQDLCSYSWLWCCTEFVSGASVCTRSEGRLLSVNLCEFLGPGACYSLVRYVLQFDLFGRCLCLVPHLEEGACGPLVGKATPSARAAHWSACSPFLPAGILLPSRDPSFHTELMRLSLGLSL